jgi:16S rRNA (guanine527-N7)-methyltransferase
MSGEAPAPVVSRETRARLEALLDLTARWTRRINLVSSESLKDGWRRHIVDSIQVHRAAPVATHWADLGTGGGYPGLVIAILEAERDTPARVTLVESDARKCAFLRAALRECGVAADVVPSRIEALPPLGVDVISARALASLDRLLAYADHHLAPGGTAIFPKGARWRDEVVTAKRNWTFKATTIPSITESDAVLLRIGEISRAPRQSQNAPDHRHRESEGGRGQDDDRDQPGRRAGEGGT